MKKWFAPGVGWRLVYAYLVLVLVLSACVPEAAVEAPQTGQMVVAGLQTGSAPTAAPAHTATLLPSATAAATQAAFTATTESLPSSTPVPVDSAASSLAAAIPDGISFDYQAIPLGKTLLLTPGGRRFTVRVNRIFTGKETEVMAWNPPPDNMQYVLVELVIDYQSGEPGVRQQLLEPYSFHLVSKGHADPGFAYFSPEPYLGRLRLEPGMDSLAYLSFMAYQDDPNPLLRFDEDGKSHFFALTKHPPEAVTPDEEVSLALEHELGTAAHPVPAGQAAYVDYQGVIYEVRVEQVVRGFHAYKKMLDGWGIEQQPAAGQEFVMPYVSVRVARAAADLSYFLPSAFTSFSGGQALAAPASRYCPAPCMPSAQLYPGGVLSGWVPLLAQAGDPQPVMVFDNRVYFQLGDSAQQTVFGPNAIGFNTRERIGAGVELKQVGPVQAVAFAPDDNLVVTAGDDKTVHAWDPASGAELHTLQGLKGSVKGVAFSVDGSRLAAVTSLGEVWAWDTATWEVRYTLAIDGSGLAVSYLPDGRLLAANTTGQIKLWLADGSEQGVEHAPLSADASCRAAKVNAFDISADGTTVGVSLSCGFGLIWKLGEPGVLWGASTHQTDLWNLRKIRTNNNVIDLSPDGNLAIFGMVYYIKRRLMLMDIVDVRSGEVLGSVGPTDIDMTVVRVAPSSDLMLGGVGNRVIVWWPEAYQWGQKNLLELRGHRARVTAIQFSSNSEILATGDYNGTTILWTVK